MKNLKGKTAIVTGATGGIGQALSRMLAEAGVQLMLLGRNKDTLAQLETELSAYTQVCCRAVDVRDEAQVAAAFDETVARFGAPDILINNAGLSIPAKLWDTELEAYETMMDTNAKGTFLCSKYFARTADAEKGGHIVQISSMAAKNANGTAPLYCTAKAAVNMMSAGMAIQLKERNIRVSTVNPSGVDTPFWGTRQVNRAALMQATDVAETVMFVLTRNDNTVISDITLQGFFKD